MLFNRLFCRKSSDSSANSTSSKGVKLNKKNHQPRRMALEPLESRDLLTVTTGAIDDAEYSQIRAQYPEFELPELQADLNVMTITPDDGALSLSDLKSAIADAGTTTQPDLILVRTSASANCVTYASKTDEISINIDSTEYGSITILGWGEENFTLDANQRSRVISIYEYESVVSLGGLTIQNGNSEGDGGGVCNVGILTIANCRISNNTSLNSGGGVYNYHEATFINCEIIDNSASSNGGGIDNFCQAVITNCTISGNTAIFSGGGIENNCYDTTATLIVSHSAITNNTAGEGGGISSQGIVAITNCNISNNTSTYYGGGLSNYYQGSATIINSTISGNIVTEPDNDNYTSSGGGIYNCHGIVSVMDCEISENTSFVYGGGVFNDEGTIDISNSAISGNSSGLGGGVNSDNSGSTTITNSIISENSASGGGGGIYNGYSAITIVNNSTVSENSVTASYGAQGGGISNNGALTVTNSSISGNFINTVSGNSEGGGIYCYGLTTIINCSIERNSASATDMGMDARGGGLYCSSKAIEIVNSSIDNNSATGRNSSLGGGIYIDYYYRSAPISITNSSISGNTSNNGGGIYNSGGEVTVTIENCKISGNTAIANPEHSESLSYGGGINCHSGVMTIVNSTITDNNCIADNGNGGGIYNYYNSTVTLTNCTVSGNSSVYGGGLFNFNTINIYNSIVACNTSPNGNDINCINKFTGQTVGVVNAYNALSSYTEWSGNNNFVYNSNLPLFYSAKDGDYRLVKDSQAVDKGNNEYAYNADLNEDSSDVVGSPRFVGENIDLGAYEYFIVNASQDSVFIGVVAIKWAQFKNAPNVRLTWMSGTTKTVLGVFSTTNDYLWDTTVLPNGYGQLNVEYLNGSGKVLFKSTLSSLILNSNENIVVHCDDISTSETWLADKVHLVAEPVNIRNGATVTIAKDAVVKFWKNAYLNVNSGSTLTVKENVIFTRAEDDEVAGDTNMDGELSRPQFGNDYIRGAGNLNISSSLVMKYVTTSISGTVSSNQTWLSGQVYRIIGDVTVANGATLTIQPGAIVKFNSGKSLIVQSGGTLNAQGTVAQPIVFTSIKDDEYGGDTNEDDGFYSPAAGDWNQIKVLGTANFDHAVIRYTGAVSGSNGAIYGENGSVVNFNNSVMEFSKYYAFSFNGGTLRAVNSVFREGQTALINMHSTSCNARFVNCTFADSSMFLWCGWGNTKFTNCIVSNITSKFVGYGSGNPSRGAFTNCVFYNPKSSGPQSFSFVGSNGNVWANPLFRNASAGDYYLMAGSPCIDAGTADGTPETDITGAPRSNDPYSGREGVVDIGAYEFVDGVVSAIDLEPVNVQAPSSVTTGDAATIQWTIRNNGSAAASGSWTDAIYLVNETSGQSVLVKECVHAGDIAPGALQTFYTDVVIPAVVEGAWKVQIRVNPNREIFEGVATDNNSILSTSNTAVYMSLLPLSDDLVVMKSGAVYKLIVKAGDEVNLKYSYASKDKNTVQIIARENVLPTEKRYGWISSIAQTTNINTSTQNIENYEYVTLLHIDASDTDRTIYLNLRSENSNVSGKLENVNDDLQVYGYGDAIKSNRYYTTVQLGKISSINLVGVGFTADMTVKLTFNNGNSTLGAAGSVYENNPYSDITGSVRLVSDTMAVATFDLTDMERAAWFDNGANYNLTVNNSVILENSVFAQKIDNKTSSNISVNIEIPDSVRVGRVYKGHITYTNHSSQELNIPVFTLQSSGDAKLGFTADASQMSSDIRVLGLGTQTAGILAPGETGRVEFYFLASSSNVINLSSWILDTTNTAMFESDYWDTWAEFHKELSDLATQFASRGYITYNYDEAIFFLKNQKAGKPSTGLSGYMYHTGTNSPLINCKIQASWIENDIYGNEVASYDFATTDEDGFYCFNNLPQNQNITLGIINGAYNLDITNVNLTKDESNMILFALPTSNISGYVTDDQGNPLSDINVKVYNETDEYFTQTNRYGSYTISDLQLGSYTVSAFDSNGKYYDSSSEVNIEKGMPITGCQIVLNAKSDYSGRVVHSDTMEPIANAELLFVGANGNCITSYTDNNGIFHVYGLPEESYTIMLQAEGFSCAIQVIDLQNADNTVFALDSIVTPLNGMVRDVNGNPVVRAYVTLSDSTHVRYTYTDENGQFELDQNGFVSPVLTVSASGYLSEQLEIVAQDTVNITLSSGATINVSLDDYSEYAIICLIDSFGNLSQSSTVADDGSVAFTAVDTGDYIISCISNDGFYSEQHVTIANAGVQNIILEKYSGEISGHVFLSESEFASEGIVAFRSLDANRSLNFEISAAIQEDGSYQVFGLTDGQYFITISANGYIHTQMINYSSSQSLHDFTCDAQASLSLTLTNLEQDVIEVFLISPDQVAIKALSKDDAGNYTLDSVSIGEYYIAVVNDSGIFIEAPISLVKPTNNVELDVSSLGYQTRTFTLKNDAGEALVNTDVIISVKDTLIYILAVSDENGEVSFDIPSDATDVYLMIYGEDYNIVSEEVSLDNNAQPIVVIFSDLTDNPIALPSQQISETFEVNVENVQYLVIAMAAPNNSSDYDFLYNYYLALKEEWSKLNYTYPPTCSLCHGIHSTNMNLYNDKKFRKNNANAKLNNLALGLQEYQNLESQIQSLENQYKSNSKKLRSSWIELERQKYKTSGAFIGTVLGTILFGAGGIIGGPGGVAVGVALGATLGGAVGAAIGNSNAFAKQMAEQEALANAIDKVEFQRDYAISLLSSVDDHLSYISGALQFYGFWSDIKKAGSTGKRAAEAYSDMTKNKDDIQKIEKDIKGTYGLLLKALNDLCSYLYESQKIFKEEYDHSHDDPPKELPTDEDNSNTVNSTDPNEIIGPVGGDFVTHDEGTEDEPYMVIDGANWITNNPNQENEYKIYFENRSTATAAAQEIYVSTTLPAEMDWDSFQIDSISIGNEIFNLSDDWLIADNTWLVNQKSTGDQIKIRFDFDDQTGEAKWYLRSYVASTADNFPASAYDGFLPPNDDAHSGEGYIVYRVKYDSDLTTGDVVSTSATIVFDTNEPIETNVWHNTIDVDIPVVQMDSAELVGGGVALVWSGSDVGSGIEQYQIYVSADGGAYTLWQSFESEVTSAVFETQTPGEYSFYILAVDGAGNIGGDPEQATPSILIESDMEMRVVTTSAVYASTDVISDNLETITDWDAFYMEFWTTNLRASQAGKTSTAKILYDSNVFQLDANQAIAAPAGITAEISAPILESNGMTSIIVTFTVGEDGYTAPGANTYWGAVHFTPNTQDGAGIQNPLESESLDVEMGGAASGTTVKAMPYDLNRDGKVNVDDFILFATVYGTNTDSVSTNDGMYTEKLLSDYDGDGAVNATDFIAFATNYGLVKGDGKNVTLPQQNPQTNGSSVPNNSTVSESIAVEQPVTNVLPEPVATEPIRASELVVATQSTSPVYEIAIESELKSAVQVLRQAHSSALLDLYDNQNESATPASLSAQAVDEFIGSDDNDAFDFLFDESRSNSGDSSDVDLSAVLDELDLELL